MIKSIYNLALEQHIFIKKVLNLIYLRRNGLFFFKMRLLKAKGLN